MAPANDKLSREKIKQSLEHNREEYELTDIHFNRLENMIYNVIHEGDNVNNHSVEHKQGKNILRLTWDIKHNTLMMYYQNYYILSFDKSCEELPESLNTDNTFLNTPTDCIYYTSEYNRAIYGEKIRNRLLQDTNYIKNFVRNNDKVYFGRNGPPSKYEKIADDTYEWSHQFYVSWDI